MKHKYRVVDTMDWFETLGIVDTLKEAKALAMERFLDTDGECEITIQRSTESGGWEQYKTPGF